MNREPAPIIQTNPHGDGFIDTSTGRRFVPVGTNYAAMLDMVDYRGQPRRFIFEITDQERYQSAMTRALSALLGNL